MVITVRRLVQILAQFKDKEFSLEDLTSKSSISLNTAKRYLREMLRHGLVNEISYGKYKASEKAMEYIEAFELAKKSVDDKHSYVFTDESGFPITLKINSIEKLYIALKHGFISEKDALRHIEKGYLVKWVSETLGAKVLAQKIQQCKNIDDVVKILEDYTRMA
ncbi:hypothetical protein QPL79_05745 [Ignisphaera sp. 4213-co]|uniref:Winged helix-turn-helix transcriptional regulator n=1 Tax=Ignisphaera cupida TaxID=3050454 RepID=A0ABD4Z6B8_9CREN|nr:hypothetical protein [Ignisphaera sp. 4213-co]MDK6028861.1 hypothetical protein [Ignisphaera sp. 4213-co]